MKIPTKKDWKDNRNQALIDLFNYIRHLFPNKNEDYLSDFETELLGSDDLLNSFFEKHGEIADNKKAFFNFCEENIDKHSKDSKYKAFTQYNYLHSDTNEDDEENKIETYGNRAEDPQNLIVEKYEAINNNHIEKQIVKEVLKKLFNHIETLPEKEQAKFKVAFISIQNRLDTDAKKSPSDMPKQVREQLKDIITKNMIYSERRAHLEDKLHPSGFWQYYLKEMGSQLLAKDSSKQKEIYKKYYRQAKFSNITRDKEKMASIINILSSEDNIDDKSKEELYKDIKNFQLNKTLDDIPEEAKTLRDKVLKGFKMTACPEYSATIATYLMHQLDRNHPIDFEDNVKKYLEHRRTCKRCRSCEEKLSKGLEYRIDRIKMKTPETYSYGYHCPTEEKIQLTKEKDLVRYYEREYRHNPCDLNYYYLILSYKIAGLEDKAKQLLNETKNIPEYKNIQRTKIATQIKGE